MSDNALSLAPNPAAAVTVANLASARPARRFDAPPARPQQPRTQTQPLRAAGQQNIDGTITDVETFAAGIYEGDLPGEVWEYKAADVKQIAANYDALSRPRDGKPALHSVPVVVTHDGVQAYAWVDDVRLDGDILKTDWRDVAPELQAAIRAGRFKKVSAEIKSDFIDRDGRVYEGPYLYRVAVIGADIPRAKGLADIPPQWFTDSKPGAKARRITRTFRFAEGMTMDFATALSFLQSKGVDVTPLSDATPPEVQALVIAVASAWQAESQQSSADQGGGQQQAQAAQNAGAQALPMPKQATYKFSVDEAQRQIKAVVDAELARLTEATEQRARETRVAGVRDFCDSRKHKLAVAENDEANPKSLRSRMIRLAQKTDDARRFTDPTGKNTFDELETLKEEIDARPARNFSEKIAAGTAPGAAGGAADVFTRVREKRKAELAAAASKSARPGLAQRLGGLPSRFAN